MGRLSLSREVIEFHNKQERYYLPTVLRKRPLEMTIISKVFNFNFNAKNATSGTHDHRNAKKKLMVLQKLTFFSGGQSST